MGRQGQYLVFIFCFLFKKITLIRQDIARKRHALYIECPDKTQTHVGSQDLKALVRMLNKIPPDMFARPYQDLEQLYKLIRIMLFARVLISNIIYLIAHFNHLTAILSEVGKQQRILYSRTVASYTAATYGK